MKKITKKTSKAGTSDPRGRTIREFREILQRTQVELANALGISAKAIQSYEQGWRPVPVRVMIQMLVLLALQQKQGRRTTPCWVIKKCSAEKRSKCPSYTIGHGQFCWFLAAKTCWKTAGSLKTKVLPCMKCAVVLRLLKS